MARTLIFNILLVITFEVFMFLNGQKKYRGYVTLKHYVLTLKMPDIIAPKNVSVQSSSNGSVLDSI